MFSNFIVKNSITRKIKRLFAYRTWFLPGIVVYSQRPRDRWIPDRSCVFQTQSSGFDKKVNKQSFDLSDCGKYVLLHFHYCFIFRTTIKISRLWQNGLQIIPITCKRSNNEIQFWINKLLWQRKFYLKKYSIKNCIRIDRNRGSAKAWDQKHQTSVANFSVQSPKLILE